MVNNVRDAAASRLVQNAGLVELSQRAKLDTKDPGTVQFSGKLEAIPEEHPFHVIKVIDGCRDNGERIPYER